MEITEVADDVVSFQLFCPEFCAVLARWSRESARWKPGPGRSFQSRLGGLPKALRREWNEALARIYPVAGLGWQWTLSRCDESFLIRRGPGGLFKREIDYLPGRGTRPRLLTLLVFLNDDFAGGRAVFPRQNRAVAPRAGKAVLFPSGVSHPHGVEPVRRGASLTLTAFLR